MTQSPSTEEDPRDLQGSESGASTLLGSPLLQTLDGVNTLISPVALRRKAYQAPLSERVTMLVLTDLVCALTACAVSFTLWHWVARGTLTGALETLGNKWHWFPVAIGIWMAIGWLFDLYDVISADGAHGLAQKLGSTCVMCLGLGLVAYFFLPDHAPRFFVVSFVLSTTLLVGIFRVMHSQIGESLWGPHRLLLIGDAPAAFELRDVLQNVRSPKLELLGWMDEVALAKHAFLTDGSDLMKFARELHIHELVVSSSLKGVEAELLRGLVACQCHGVRVSSMADLYRKASRQIPIKYIERDWVLTSFQDHPLFTRVQLGIKRLVDLVGACLAMPVFLALLIPVAIAIRWNSAGPIFYRQIRSGRGGEPFNIWKFRTMGVDAESDGVARWAGANDVRVTRVGRFLRKTRIDELPQIINVLRGEMSLVGPRPERPELEATLEIDLPYYAVKHLVKPGVTGWAQIHYKYGNTVDDSLRKLQYDFYYIKYWSLQLDFYVIFRTIGVVAGLKGL